MHVPSGVRRVADPVAAVLLTVIMVVASEISTDQPTHPPGVVIVLAAAVVGAWAAIAQRFPRIALAGACVTYFAALAIGVPAFSPAFALGYELFVIGVAGGLRWGTAVVALIGLSSITYRTLGEGAEPFATAAIGTLYDLALLVVLLLLGETLRSRGALVRLAQREHEQQVTAERLAIARDLHDVLAHTVTVVGIQANVAADNLDDRPERAKEALDRVREAGDDALADLRSTIAVLRTRTEPGNHPAPGLGELTELADSVRAAGLAVSLTVDAPDLRPAVELTVYRVVQESLTNALRHSQARAVDVAVTSDQDDVLVTVHDPGPPRPARPGGSGLRGMAERVAAQGGMVHSGPEQAGGWRVLARIPRGGRK